MARPSGLPEIRGGQWKVVLVRPGTYLSGAVVAAAAAAWHGREARPAIQHLTRWLAG